MWELLLVLRPPNKTTTITPSDATDLSGIVSRGVFIGGSGNLVFKLSADTVAVTVPVTAGQFVAGNFLRVMAATTATNVVGIG